jgi:murein tripeptide amidase MpaA
VRQIRAGVVVAALAAASALRGSASADDADRPLLGLTFDRYYDAAAMKAALERIHGAFPQWTRLESMGTSREGRPLWVLSVFDPVGRPPEDRPAMYVDANTHGNEVQGAEVVLFTAKYLLIRRDDPWVAALLKRVVFHLAPCVNPDSRERFLHGAWDEHGPRRVPRPVDDDRDGIADEDGPDDVDGDGEILQMRRADPDGDQVTDERDDRLMRPRKPGEKGQWRSLGQEGTDEDGDGLVNEDGVGGVDPNRNWPAEWRPEPDQSGAGPFPLSEPETRATALWILAHPRIAAVQSYHNAGQMILRPPGARTDADAPMPAEDRVAADEIARRGGLLLPGYRYLQIREGLYRVQGGFLDWTFGALGISSFTNELWGLQGSWSTAPGGDSALEALRWNDVALHGKGFVRWHAAKHPTYGDVEVGGWRRYTVRSTPPDFLPDLCLRNCLFTLEHASCTPDLGVRSVTRLEDGRVRVTVEDRAVLPTISVWARRHSLLPPDEVGLEGAEVVAAAEVVPGKASEVLTVKRGRARLPDGVPGGGSRTVDLFLAPGSSPREVVVSSRLGGVVRAPLPR